MLKLDAEDKLPPGFRDIDDAVSEFEASPEGSARMKAARERIRKRLKIEANTLKGLRLKAGLSQVQLAQLIGSKQPHVARMESGSGAMVIETCRKLAEALGVDMNTLDQALRLSQKQHKEANA
jgi:ribosome-binding protein aMBF1 (putative translation factor)